jgi:integrase/recombinase XerD
MQAPLKTNEELDAVFAHIDTMREPEKYRLMLLLSVRLGLRPIELSKLERSWLQGYELRIPIGRSKRGVGRTIPVNDEILQAVEAHMGSRQGRVFLTAQGAPVSPQGISDAMRRLYREANQHGSCYSGRRTMATRLVDSNVNILVVQKILGHASPVTTLEYVGVTPAMMQRALFA